MSDDSTLSNPLDTSVPHVARVYNYLLGGKDNYAADREVAEKMMAGDPFLVAGVRANRAFLGRSVEYLVTEAGIRQFLDIGTGIPTADNTHEVAQRHAPDSRIVYVDNDPIVLAHARALLTSDPAGATDYIDADARDTETILEQAARTLDFEKPVAIIMIGVLHCIPDADDPAGLTAKFMDAVPARSYLTIAHVASDIHAEQVAKDSAALNRSLANPVTFRDRDQVAGFFKDLELVEPGLVPAPQWRPSPEASTALLSLWAGVARKPAH
jgi:S-adenosyl methyltransferase